MGCCNKRRTSISSKDISEALYNESLVPEANSTNLKSSRNSIDYGDFPTFRTSIGGDNTPATLEDFKHLKVLGQGSFGKVILVKNENNNKLYENFKSQKIPKKKNCIHIKATSALSIGTNQAFFEANNYINDRKMRRNQSLLNNKMLLKECSYIVPLNDTNKNNESKGTNNTKENNNFSKTMRISKSSKFMKFVNN